MDAIHGDTICLKTWREVLDCFLSQYRHRWQVPIVAELLLGPKHKNGSFPLCVVLLLVVFSLVSWLC